MPLAGGQRNRVGELRNVDDPRYVPVAEHIVLAVLGPLGASRELVQTLVDLARDIGPEVELSQILPGEPILLRKARQSLSGSDVVLDKEVVRDSV